MAGVTRQRRRLYAPGRFVNWCALHHTARVPVAMNEQLPLTAGCWARVRLQPECPGDLHCPGPGRKPHHPAEDGSRVHISVVNAPGDHCVVGNYQGAPWRHPNVRLPPGGLGIGRFFSADELEVLPPDRIDPTPEDYAERRAWLQRALLGAYDRNDRLGTRRDCGCVPQPQLTS